MNITKKNIRKLLEELAQQYKVRLHFSKNMVDDGAARYWKNSITISVNQSAASQMSTFFHEIGHLYCWENSLWVSYHINRPISELTKIEKRAYLLTALKTERWVDNWGKKEMKKHFPDIKYHDGYFSKKDGRKFTKEIKKELYG